MRLSLDKVSDPVVTLTLEQNGEFINVRATNNTDRISQLVLGFHTKNNALTVSTYALNSSTDWIEKYGDHISIRTAK